MHIYVCWDINFPVVSNPFKLDVETDGVVCFIYFCFVFSVVKHRLSVCSYFYDEDKLTIITDVVNK